jgi:hypothetical protein
VKRAAAATLALVALLAARGWAQNAPAQGGTVATAQELTLALPHPLRDGETAGVEVHLGPIARGRVVTVTTAAGQPLGTISPFGTRVGEDAGTYTLPLPADAIRDGRVTIRLAISQAGGPPRPPTAQEVPSVRLITGGPSP